MSVDDGTVLSLFGWCAPGPTGTRTDAFCNLCRREYTDQWGIKHRCSCPSHLGEADAR